jgi:hypothetical protein
VASSIVEIIRNPQNLYRVNESDGSSYLNCTTFTYHIVGGGSISPLSSFLPYETLFDWIQSFGYVLNRVDYSSWYENLSVNSFVPIKKSNSNDDYVGELAEDGNIAYLSPLRSLISLLGKKKYNMDMKHSYSNVNFQFALSRNNSDIHSTGESLGASYIHSMLCYLVELKFLPLPTQIASKKL